ncbi:MAG: DMT family transporter, partial [Desulfopila sp.]
FMLPWLRPAPGQMKPLLQVAFLLGVLHFSMMFIGLDQGGNIASIAITSQLYVPFSAIMAAVFLGERLSALRILAIALAFGGILLVGFDPVVFSHFGAMLWVTGASLVMALATILMRRCPNLGIFKLQAWIAAVATPSLLLLSFIFESGQLHSLTSCRASDFWVPVYSAIGASVVGHGIVYFLLGRYPVSIVTPSMLLTPLLASVSGVLFLHDQIGWKLIIGGGLTLLGTMLVSVDPRHIARWMRHKANAT